MQIQKSFLIKALMVGAMGFGATASASPWFEAGNIKIKHDLKLLSDYGLYAGTTGSWPIPKETVHKYLKAKVGKSVPAPVRAAHARVFNLVHQPSGKLEVSGFARASNGSSHLRTYNDSPRANYEVRLNAEYNAGNFSTRLSTTFAGGDPEDGRHFRIDGSYLAYSYGNWIASLGAQERYWGPGVDGSLIMGNNSRPVPAFTLQRGFTEMDKNGYFSWLGGVDFVTTLGFLGGERTISDAMLWGTRIGFKPNPNLEIGLNRTAIWGGKGQKKDGAAIIDAIVGRDSNKTEDNLNNQMTSIDFNYNLRSNKNTVYGQIATDTALGDGGEALEEGAFLQLGFTHLLLADKNTRGYLLRFDYTTTESKVHDSDNRDATINPGTYNHARYTTGYRYKGRSLGSPLDGESNAATLGVTFVDGKDRTWDGAIRLGTFFVDNFGQNAPNTASTESDFYGFDITVSGKVDGVGMKAGLNVLHTDEEVQGAHKDTVYGFWQLDF